MKIDLVSIFPEYFDVLSLSLMGRAKGSGIVDVAAHNLRDFTHDRHRTVDDTPYGGGAGMVMKPEPWGEAFDQILTARGSAEVPLVIFPSPAGALFTQATAERLSREPHLVFACGRYEGIDQRVQDYAAATWRAESLSLGDYVLNGGEVAAVAMIEAIVRLLPDVVGNPESLVEESHQDGLLEYPSYTKPASWRGLEVPPVLLSGDHGKIAAWRRDQQLERTRATRPDLLG